MGIMPDRFNSTSAPDWIGPPNPQLAPQCNHCWHPRAPVENGVVLPTVTYRCCWCGDRATNVLPHNHAHGPYVG